MNEDAPAPQRRMIRTASGLKPMPTIEERREWSRRNAREVLLEAGADPAAIEAAVDKFLASPPLFEIPGLDDLGKT